MRERVLEILQDVVPDVDFENETAMISDSVVDSFAVVAMVNELNDELDIDIPAREILPANFETLDAIVALVEKYA